ncbi:MAG: serine/threonine protein kinase, partial [Myxococcales bacterium]|nr:serine/threonine protein kinase [Myxococcales bacterium]
MNCPRIRVILGGDMHEQFGRYILLERIAIGGMAEIFRAKAPGLGGFEKVLAIKRLHPRYSQDADFIEMLIDEARITVELAHSNIGQIFDLGKVEDHYFIAMEYIEGRDLYRVMKRLRERHQQFPFDAAAYVAMECCAGLDYAHRKRDGRGRPLHIIHRDVSPQNVLISMEGDVKLVDFGIAKAALRAYETESGIIKGKFYYMSPEQARGEHLDHRTDIFSLGIVLYEMLTGDLLYKDDDEVTLLSKVRRADIAPPSTMRPDLPPALERIAMRALARDREDRYPSAQHMQRELARFLR